MFSKIMYEKDLLTKDKMKIETLAGIKEVECNTQNEKGNVKRWGEATNGYKQDYRFIFQEIINTTLINVN